ncbi:MAG: AAA-like domain-containing protein [Oscillatoriophycideae cyanobacterium NC_groundwater_1537_Pr4_S-0.65um_50_18]|nr:AAA-like domain-containing protein [Oscillatoriophycideae cyanobacterium NC_groundwater_1537_Pr4_S-0.65um_50_18]
MNEQQFERLAKALSNAEKEILWLFWSGKSDEEVAKSLSITPATVRKHLSNAARKLGVSNEFEKNYNQRENILALLGEQKKLWMSMNQDKFVSEDAQFYVSRPKLESLFQRALSQPGALLRVKAPQSMGKTTLINHCLRQMSSQGFAVAILSLKSFDQADFSSLERFLRMLCIEVSKELKIDEKLDELWEISSGSKSNATSYFENYILMKTKEPLILCIDDVDEIFLYPDISRDFFGMIRAWFERAMRRPIWRQLRSLISYSTETYIQLDINESPFNVGEFIEVSEFSSEQIQELLKIHGLVLDSNRIQQLEELLGGHPHLLQQAIAYLKKHPEVEFDQFLTDAPSDVGIYNRLLQKYFVNLKKLPDLSKALKNILNAEQNQQIEILTAYRLLSMGLVKRQNKQLIIRCNLYQKYFRSHIKEL